MIYLPWYTCEQLLCGVCYRYCALLHHCFLSSEKWALVVRSPLGCYCIIFPPRKAGQRALKLSPWQTMSSNWRNFKLNTFFQYKIEGIMFHRTWCKHHFKLYKLIFEISYYNNKLASTSLTIVLRRINTILFYAIWCISCVAVCSVVLSLYRYF